MTINLSELWDFGKPELSEQRFRAVLAVASGDEALILQTQIARTYGLRGDFAQAQQILAGLTPQIMAAGLEAQVHYYLESGRTLASAAHLPESQTSENKELASAAYLYAFDLASNGKFDTLAIDALHMMSMVDTAPEQQVEWNRRAIACMKASTQTDAKNWEGSLRNNLGYALHLLGRYEEALVEFKLALAVNAQRGNPETIRIACWMIAWTLRALERLQEALEIQLRLEKECDQAGEPDPYVFEELELLYRALNNGEQASFYADRRKALM